MQDRLSRREFAQQAMVAGGTLALGASASSRAIASSAMSKLPAGKAKACIFLWMGGGMCQVDTFDPKRVGDPVKKIAGSAYPAIDTAIPGVQICEHLEKTAPLMDRGIILRTVDHPLSAEHAAPTNLFKTGRLTSETIVYPSIGSIINHELGPREDGIPPYVVMGYPNVTRGPGFLGSRYSYIYLTDTEAGPTGLKRPADVTDVRQRRRMELLSKMRKEYLAQHPDDYPVQDYDTTIEEAFKLTGPKFTSVFNLTKEPSGLRNEYGDEFGQRCLLARRLVQSGVRFVEVSSNMNFLNGTGWDTHRHGQLDQWKLIRGLDQSLSTLLIDLEKNKMLDETLVVIATEFGRPPEWDGGGGRGHQSKGFSTVLFGGGLKTGQAIGSTDDLGKKIVERPISLPDWHATIHAAMGINPNKELYAGDRPVPITDHGKPVMEVFG